MDTKPLPPESWRPKNCERIALVLQGGGALGAYQAGVYQALHEAGLEPDWVSGVSIGGINAAIIAGNRIDKRLERLREFWTRITDRTLWLHAPDGDIFRQARNLFSSMTTALSGQPGFFAPHQVNPWLLPAGAKDATSYYDTSPLRETLMELVDFDYLNASTSRFSVGAVNVLSGNFIFFDNKNGNHRARTCDGVGRAAAGFPDGQDRHRLFLGWRHRIQHAAAASTGAGRQSQLPGFSGRSVQRLRCAAAHDSGCDGPSQGYPLFLAHRQVTDMFARLQRWKQRAYEALIKIPEADLSDEQRDMRDKLASLPQGHDPATDLSAEIL